MPAPVPLPIGWHLLSRVTCPSCSRFMNFNSPSNAQREKLEREMYCANGECEQHGIVYSTKLTVDGLTVTGEKN